MRRHPANIRVFHIVLLALAVGGCQTSPEDPNARDLEYFAQHRDEWERAVSAYLSNRDAKVLEPFLHGQGRFLGLTIYCDCFLFEMDSEVLDSRRAVVYRLSPEQFNKESEYIFLDREYIPERREIEGNWLHVVYEYTRRHNHVWGKGDGHAHPLLCVRNTQARHDRGGRTVHVIPRSGIRGWLA